MTDYEDALAALADPTRRAILERLEAAPLPVGELARGLPVSRPAVSQHLRVLERARLVRPHAAGTRRIYHLERRGFEALRRYLERFWGDLLEAFRRSADARARAEGVAPPRRRRLRGRRSKRG